MSAAPAINQFRKQHASHHNIVQYKTDGNVAVETRTRSSVGAILLYINHQLFSFVQQIRHPSQVRDHLPAVPN